MSEDTTMPTSTIRLDAQVAPEHRALLFAALHDVLGDCAIEEATVHHVLGGARRVETTRTRRLVLYIQPLDPPSFDFVQLMSEVCEQAGVDTWVMTTWAPVPHLTFAMQGRAVVF